MENEHFIHDLVTRANHSQAASGMDWRIAVIGIGDDFLTVRGMATDEAEEDALYSATYANVRYCGVLNATISGKQEEIPLVSIEFMKSDDLGEQPGSTAQICSKRIHVEADPNAFWAVLYSAYNEGLL